MAEVVEEMPERRVSKEGSRYDRYMDGQVWKLKLGQDCPADAGDARNTMYRVARRHGTKAATRVVDGYLYVQAREGGNQ